MDAESLRMANPDLVKETLKTAHQYLRLIINKDNAHYAMAERLGQRNRWLGIPVIVTTSVVSTAIFATLQESTSRELRVATGLVSVAATVLASLQTFLGYAGQAEQHRKAAVSYSHLRREFEQFELRLDVPMEEEALFAGLKALTAKLDDIENGSPHLDQKLYERIRDKHVPQRLRFSERTPRY